MSSIQHATHMQGRRDRCTDENGAGNMIKACRDAGDVKVRTGTHVQWLILGLISGGHHETFGARTQTQTAPHANTDESQLKRGALTRMSSSRQQLLSCFAAYDISHRGDYL